MSDRLQELAVFVRAAESGSFSKAARELGLSQPSVSRIIGELETRLGVKLLLRTTRRITVTDAGALFLTRAREVLADIEDAEDAARGINSLRGTIRITMPVMYGARKSSRACRNSWGASPAARRAVRGRRTAGPVAEGTDVAIRLGLLNNSGFGARSLANTAAPRGGIAILSCQSAAHRKRRPTSPRTTASSAPASPAAPAWSFTRNGTETSVNIRGRITTNSGPGVFACVLAGLGIAITSPIMAGPEIAAGTLMPLLKSYKLPPIDVYAVFPAGRAPLDQGARSGRLSRDGH